VGALAFTRRLPDAADDTLFSFTTVSLERKLGADLNSFCLTHEEGARVRGARRAAAALLPTRPPRLGGAPALAGVRACAALDDAPLSRALRAGQWRRNNH
jgi:hypothetical protein